MTSRSWVEAVSSPPPSAPDPALTIATNEIILGGASSSASDTPRTLTVTTAAKPAPTPRSPPRFRTATMGNFDSLHSAIFPIIKDIVHKPEHQNHPFVQNWFRMMKQRQKIGRSSSLRTIKKAVTSIKDLLTYQAFLKECPTIEDFITFQDNGSGTTFDYYIIPKQTEETETYSPSQHEDYSTRKTVISIPSEQKSTDTDDPTPKNTNVTALSLHSEHLDTIKENAEDDFFQIGTFMMHASSNIVVRITSKQLHPDGSNLYDVVTVDGQQMYNIRESNLVPFNTLQDISIPPTSTTPDTNVHIVDTNNLSTPAFAIFHYRIFGLIQKWIKETGEYPEGRQFLRNWRRWLYQGLLQIQEFQDVAKAMRIGTLQEYVNAITDCDAVSTYCHFEWHNTNLKYSINEPSEDDDTKSSISLHSVDASQIASFKSKLSHFTSEFNINIKSFEKQLHQVNLKLNAFDQRLRAQSQAARTNFSQINMENQNQLQLHANNTIMAFQIQLKEIMDHSIQTVKSKIGTLLSTIDGDILKRHERFKDDLTEAMDDAIDQAQREVYQAGDEAIRQLRQTNMADINPSPTEPSVPRHPSFQHVDPEYAAKLMNFVPSNPYAQPASNQPTPTTSINVPTEQGSQPATQNTNRPVPFPNAYSGLLPYQQIGADGLPIIQQDSIMKRTSVVFNGFGDLMVFYNQLLNGIEPYGVYLIPLAEAKINQSLCPESYNGIPITPACRKTMGGALYQKLQDHNVIPLEFSSARTIINRFAQINDGYQVLYAMVEPILETDALYSPPESRNFSDIYEYATKVDSYFLFEERKERKYNEREQVTIFIRGLDARYDKAIQRVRQLLDVGKKTDSTVPEPLKLTALPTSIERYLSEANGTNPTICALLNPHDRPRTNDRKGSNNRSFDTNRASSFTDRTRQGDPDARCGICHIKGHNNSQCNGYAKHLLYILADKNMDNQIKSKVVENYKHEIKLRGEQQLKRRRMAVVRQLWDSGKTYEEVEAALLGNIPTDADASGGDLVYDDNSSHNDPNGLDE